MRKNAAAHGEKGVEWRSAGLTADEGWLLLALNDLGTRDRQAAAGVALVVVAGGERIDIWKRMWEEICR
jgi:hypothetical protein